MAKKHSQQLSSVFLVLALVLTSFTLPTISTEAASKKVTVSKVAITKPGTKTLVLKKGKTYSLKTSVTVKPNKSANKKVTYTSSSPKVVSVTSKGKVKALKTKGTSVITVTSAINKKKKATIKVTIGLPVTNVSISEETLSFAAGDTVTLKAYIAPTKATIAKYIWSSSNTKIATVTSAGVVTGVDVGEANIIATSTDGSGKKASCTVTITENPANINYLWKTATTLKDLYKNNFKMGVAVDWTELTKGAPSVFVKYHHNSITMGNEMKAASTLSWHGSEKNISNGITTPSINFAEIDKVLEYAKNNGLQVRYHCLVWHAQTPKWFFCVDYNPDNAYVDKATMAARMESYITQIIDHVETNYPGIVYSWDVVNEAVDGVGSGTYGIRNRNNMWFDVLGEDYVYYAFKYARTALNRYPSTATLLYNDYSTYDKVTKITGMIKNINKDRKLCDGIGMQSHLSLSSPSLTSYENALRKFSEAGFEIQITELDIGLNYKNDAMSADELTIQAKKYKDVFQLCQKYPAVTSVTLWGIADQSGIWRVNQFPLLLNPDMTVKPSFWAVLQQ